MKFFSFITMLLLLANGLSGQNNITGTIMHDGLLRDYRLHFPPGFSTNKPAPLVFNLHGYTSNAAQQELYSGMNAVADTAGFVVCYPNGIANAWNVGWAFGSTADDTGFISAMIDEFHTKYNIDINRVYSCGMSNGGFMSYKLACDLNNRIAAIASVTGSMVPAQLTTCIPGRAVPVMEIHGTADNVVGYQGTALISAGIPAVLDFWSKNNGCTPSPSVTAVPNTNTADNSTAEKWVYNDCDPHGDVIHFKVLGGAHTWPGSQISVGVTCQDFNASVEIWKFFRRWELPQTSGASADEVSNPAPVPNPFVTDVNLWSRNGGELVIHDISGRQFKAMDLLPGINKVEGTALPQGFYIFTVREGFTTHKYKILKN